MQYAIAIRRKQAATYHMFITSNDVPRWSPQINLVINFAGVSKRFRGCACIFFVGHLPSILKPNCRKGSAPKKITAFWETIHHGPCTLPLFKIGIGQGIGSNSYCVYIVTALFVMSREEVSMPGFDGSGPAGGGPMTGGGRGYWTPECHMG